MTSVTLVPAFAALCVARLKGFRHVLVFVALPALILLPNYYSLELAGLPDATFHNYLLCVTFAALVAGRDRRLLTLQAADLLPALFVLWIGISETTTQGGPAGRNLLAVQGMLLFLPYAIGRAVGRSEALLTSTIVMVAVLGAAIGALAPIEARLGRNPFDWWRSVWPKAVPWEGALYRGGFRRVAGPFAHPICMGFFYAMILPLVAWLGATSQVRRRAFLLLSAGCLLGLLCTISRGPLLGAGMALLFVAVAWSPARRVVAAGLLLALVPVGLVLGPAAIEYVSVGRDHAGSEAQETASYRYEMMENYLPVVDERPWAGWGKEGFPVVDGQASIDNQFLLVALEHGYPAALLFAASLVLPLLLLGLALRRQAHHLPLPRLGWALLAALIGALATQWTVFSGPQTVQVMMLLAGISVSVAALLRQSRPAGAFA